MASSTTIKRDADGKKGMTFQELADFVTEAQNAGIPYEAVVGANITWGANLKSIEVTG